MMRHPFDIARFSYGELADTGNPVWRTFIPITSDDDVEEFGELDVMQSLGISAVPAATTSDGHAEGVVLRSCGNTDGVVVGARDTRSATVYGNLAPGDSCLHATGPDAVAQVQTKANGQVVLYTTDKNGDTMTVAVDGKNGKIQITSGGGLIELDNDGEKLSLVAPGGKSSIIMSGDTINIVAANVIFGTVPTAPLLAGTAGPAGLPVPGLFAGT